MYIYSGRGVSVDIKMDDEALNRETWAQYYNDFSGADPHAVCIVGWDDDYVVSNFSTAPPGNGAWIVKNSYGSQTDIVPGGLAAADGTTKDANGTDEGNESRQPMAGNPGVRTCSVKKTSAEIKTSAAHAGKTSDTTVTHPAPVPTGDDAEPALWYTLFAQALACMAAVFTLHRRRRRAPGSFTDRTNSDSRR